MRSRYCLFAVLVLAMVLGQTMSRSLESNITIGNIQDEQSSQSDNHYSKNNLHNVENQKKGFLVSNTEINGILDPVTVEQLGYYATGNISARTDTGANTASDLSLDVDNGWLGSIAEVEVWDLERLFVVNGSFDDGIPGQNLNPNITISNYPYGWSAISYDTSDEETQMAAYDDSGRKYVVAENQGVKVGPSGVKYDHNAGSYVLWNQTVNNTPYTEDFILSFDYLYQRGPLDKNATEPVPGNCSITVFVNDTVIWYQSLPKLQQRGVWYSTGSIPINLVGAASTFNLKIGLVIDEYMNLNAEMDYDNDTIADGIGNTAYITVNVDDVSFTGLNPPTFEEVKFEFIAGNETVAVTGSSGQGNASIVNQTYWRYDPVPSLVTTNVSCSFEYESRLLSHRFLNSTWTTDPTKPGVYYSSVPNSNPELSLNTYLGTTGNYEEFTINITYPVDWEKGTVLDPFLNDVTNQCTLGTGFVTIPESLLDILGWWKVELEAPNYVKSIEIQKYEPLTTNWITSTQFRSGNSSRAAINIGTQDETSKLDLDPVNVSYILPNGSLWSSESVYSDIAGEVNGSKQNLGAFNTSAGNWTVEVHWTNGTEIGYGYASFAMIHATSLIPQYTEIESDVGPLVTNFLTFTDADNGDYLMDENATIVGNWSVQNVQFAPNLLRNWWEGDFNTSRVGGGVFLVIVNASLPYYDNATSQFTINCTYSTTLNLRDDTTVDIEFQEKYEIVFYYKYTNGTGISDASISFDYSGPENGLSNSSPISHNTGNYSLNVTGLKSGTYSIEITASKKYYETSSDQFTLIVNEVGTELLLLNGTSGISEYQEGYRLVLHYKNSTGQGLAGATVENVSVTPLSGLEIGTTQDDMNGNYSILLTPTTVTTFSVVIKANLTNHETKYVTFTLTATEIQTTLTLNTTVKTIGVTESYTVSITYIDSDNTGIDSADLAVYDSSPKLEFDTIKPIGNGNYTLTIDPHDFGTFLVKMNASKQYYQSGYTSFTLIVEAIETDLISLNGTSGSVRYQKNYTLVVSYLNSTGQGLAGATLRVIDVTPSLGLVNYTPVDKGTGNYSIVLWPNATTTFTIQIRANLTAHQTKYLTFTLTGLQVLTTLTLNTTVKTIGVIENYTVRITYVDDDNKGIENATIMVYDPPPDLDFSEITEIGDGNYTLTIDPLDFGTFLVKINASKQYYQSGYTSFTLIADPVEMDLIVLNGTADSAKYLEDYRVVVRYQIHDTGEGVSGATVEIVSITPSSGLINQTPMVDEGDGNYSIILRPNTTDTFTISFRANITAHETKIVTFTLTGTEAITFLTLNTTSVTIDYGQEYTVLATLENESHFGIEEAIISVPDPPAAIGISAIYPLGEGNYTITLSALNLGTYVVTVKASKENYEDRFESFSITIEEIGTSLVSLNETSDSVGYLEEFRLVLRYTNSTGHGLTGATVTNVSISPSTGLNILNRQEIGDGNYSFTMQPTMTKTFTILFRANLTYHETGFLTFVLTATAIPTTLILNSSIESIGVTETYTIKISYRDDLNNGIDEANISIVDPPAYLSFSNETLGDGNYTVTVHPSNFGTFLITIAVEKENYQSRVDSFSLTVTAVQTELILNGTAGFSQYQENFTLVFKYLNSTGHGLPNATVQIIDIDPAGGLITYTPQDKNNGNYSIILQPNATVTFTILIQVNLTAHETQYGTFTLTGTAIPTLIGLNISQGASISFGEQIPVLVTYTDEDANGLEKATINFTANEGIGVPEIMEISDGNYSVTFHPNTQGTYIITISAAKENYQTRFTSFSLSVEEIETILEVKNGTSDQVEYGEDYRIVVYYTNILDQGLENATIQIDSVNPETGLDNGTTISEDAGYYSIIVKPTVSSVLFTIVIKAELSDHQTKLVTFTLSALNASTILKLKESSKTIPLDGEYTLHVGFYDQHLNGLSEANVEVSDEEELDLTISEVEDGNYSLLFKPLELGTYLLTIRISKPNYKTASETFSLTIDEINTKLTLPNGTDDSVRFGGIYDLIVRYQSSSGIGLGGAIISVISVSPESGLSIASVEEGENGYYTINLTPNIAESFILTLKANLTNYKIKIVTFTLTVNKISTTLTLDESVGSVAIDRNYTVQVYFADDEEKGIENAGIIILNAPHESELNFSDVIEQGDGYYNITIFPRSEIQLNYTYTILIRAYLANHENSTVGFNLHVTLVPTRLRIANSIFSATIDFSDTYEFVVIYERTDSNESVFGASINVGSESVQGLSWETIEEENGYRVIFKALTVKSWLLEITGSRPDYEIATIEFTLTVNNIDTSLDISLETTNLMINRLGEYMFNYSITSNNSGIEGAIVRFSGEAYNWTSFGELGEGEYIITIVPVELGIHSVTITFEKYGFITRNYRLRFSVSKIPMEIKILSTPSLLYDNLTVKLIESVNSDERPVTKASVSCFVINHNGIERGPLILNETKDGNYYASIPMSDSDIGSVTFRFNVVKENYELETASKEFNTDIIDPWPPMVGPIIRNSVPISLTILSLISVVLVQRVYAKRKRKQNLEALAIKRRFDDLKNLIGVLVLHKSSGLPLYSRMLTTGFDSSMISAFITAIRNFRSEIETDTAEAEFDLVPISDIVRVVATRSLLCAFITVSPPTPTQSEKMIEFAKAAGSDFDDLFAMIPAEVIDEETVERFECLFNEKLDGKLLKKFRMAEVEKFPRRLKCVERKFEHLEATDGFELDDLATSVASCGLEEARAYKIIMDYIEKGTIVPLSSEEEQSLELDWKMEDEMKDGLQSTEGNSGDTEASI